MNSQAKEIANYIRRKWGLTLNSITELYQDELWEIVEKQYNKALTAKDQEIAKLREELLESKRFGEEIIARDRVIKELRKKVEELERENEILAWNLGGCSTYAKGYDINEGHSKKMARPALDDVLELALKYDKLRSALDVGIEALGEYVTGSVDYHSGEEEDWGYKHKVCSICGDKFPCYSVKIKSALSKMKESLGEKI